MAEEDGDATSIVENVLMDDDEDDDNDDNDDDGDPAATALTTLDAIHDITDPTSTPTLLYSRADEQQDMNATIEHLIISGNYYRHQQWRMKEWEHKDKSRHSNDKNQMNENSNDTLPSRQRHKRRRNSDLVAANESFGSSRCSSEQDIPSTSSSSSQLDQQQRKAQRQSPVATHILHAQDARLYNPHNDKNDGMEPDLWPKPPYTMAKEAPLSDQRWEEEWSDSIDPIAFSILRLSENIVEQDSQPSYHSKDISCPDATVNSNNNHDSTATAARIMLLQCWERAVHASATTMTISSSSSSLQEQQSPFPISPTATTLKTSTTRDEAIRICQQLQLLPQLHTTTTTGTTTNTMMQPEDKYQCSGCRSEFTTKQLLHDHFYGTDNAKDDDDDDGGTCAWMCIYAQRRNRTALVLENEVRTLSQQFVNHILFHPDAIRHSILPQHPKYSNSPPSSRFSRCMDGLDIMRMVQQELQTSRKIMSTGRDTGIRSSMNATSISGRNSNMDDSVVFETLEISMQESPLPINAAVLEAVRYRWMDRYGKVPR